MSDPTVPCRKAGPVKMGGGVETGDSTTFFSEHPRVIQITTAITLMTALLAQNASVFLRLIGIVLDIIKGLIPVRFTLFIL